MTFTEISGKLIPTFGLEEGTEETIRFLDERNSKGLESLVAIGAKSSAGKGYVIKKPLEYFQGKGVSGKEIDGDDYYFGNPLMQEMQRENPQLNWDHPGAVERDRIYRNMRSAREGKSFIKPCYRRISGTRAKSQVVHPHKIFFVGYNYALYDLPLCALADLRVFVEASKHTRLIRRLLRDPKEFGLTPSEVLRYVIEVVEPMAEKFIEPTKERADMIIINDLIPELEYLRTGLFHQQFKFPGSLDPDFMRRHGAGHLLSGKQMDRYYTPEGQDVLATDEIMRIRQEGTLFQFSNKGPKRGSSLCERPKFEFPIERDIPEVFPGFYGREIFSIEKDRTLYEIDGVVVAVDENVSRRTSGSMENLGSFIEIRRVRDSADSDDSLLKSVAGKLGLSMSDATARAYVDI